MNAKEFVIFVSYFQSETIIYDISFQTIKHLVILQSHISTLQNTHKIKYYSNLQQIEKGNFELVQPIDNQAIRFSVLSDVDFNEYYHQKPDCIYCFEEQLINENIEILWEKLYCVLSKLKVGNNKIMFGSINLSNITLSGTVVSMWKLLISVTDD